MSKMQTHNHEQNQRGWKQPMGKPSSSSSKQIGITSPMGKPSPAKSNNSPGIMPKHGKPRQAEEATSPATDTSNGGM